MNTTHRCSVSRVLAGLASVLVVTGCGVAETAQPVPDLSSTSSPAVPGGASPSTTASPRPIGPKPIPERTAEVLALELPTIGLTADRLEALKLLSDGSLAAPEDPALAGWYADGVVPGELGPAIIAGHVDSKTGPAIFAQLGRLEPGDEFTVTVGEDGKKPRTVGFTVDRLVQAAKDKFPTEEVYRSSPDAQLRLITCSGTYDRVVGSYTDNTVVFATADPSPR